MICGSLLCTECGIVVSVVNPNNENSRICLDCGNSHGYYTGRICCSECGSDNSQRILHQKGEADEICPKCKKGLLHFCI